MAITVYKSDELKLEVHAMKQVIMTRLYKLEQLANNQDNEDMIFPQDYDINDFAYNFYDVGDIFDNYNHSMFIVCHC